MVNFASTNKPPVTAEEMREIYAKIATPKKIGAVIKMDEHFTDSPTVFRKDGVFYMYYIAISKDCSVSGYETHLSKSEDLIHWTYCGPVFRRNDLNRWDSKQCAGYAAFVDTEFGGSAAPQKVNGHYYISYLAGNSDGYEPDPLYMGLAKSTDPTDPNGFTRFPEPILRPDDADSRELEKCTLYKSFLFEDTLQVTGYKYVNAYNGKANDATERIFLAVSNDGEHWERYGDRAVVDLVSGDPAGRICGDPQILRIGDIYVMLFFRLRDGIPAFNTFACSRDLVNWTHWDGEPLIRSECDWENVHAHKPWLVHHNGKNYHFYCAVNTNNERFIALATSE